MEVLGDIKKPEFDLSKLQVLQKEQHDKHAGAEMIIGLIESKPPYGFSFWCKKIGNVPPSLVHDLVLTAEKLPAKYSKAGWLRNRLQELNQKS